LVKPKYADLTNNSGNNTGRVSQSGAFLEAFVHKNVKWAHIDIGMSG
jgi:leucyl aminopeptidase